MGIFALSFLAHAFETAWAVKSPEVTGKSTGNLLTKTLDYKRTEKAARIATAMMILGFILLFAGVVARGVSAKHVPWGNMYEFSITGAMAFVGAYLFALREPGETTASVIPASRICLTMTRANLVDVLTRSTPRSS